MSINLREFSGSSFIKLGDVKDDPVRKRIASVVLGKYNKPDVIFDDGSRLSANATNVKVLRRAYGDDSENLIGKEVELFEGEIEFQDQMKPAVLIEPITPSTKSASDQKAKSAPKALAPDFDDDLPEWSPKK